MSRVPALGLVAVLLVPSTGLLAQTPSLTPGSRIRVRPDCTAPGARACAPVIGQFLGFQGDSLLVQADDGRARAIPRDPGMRLEVSAGRRRHTLLGLGLGTLVGLGTGAALVSSCTTGSEDDGICNILYLITVPAGAGLGTLVGALSRSERWQPVANPGMTLRIVPLPRRVTVALTVPF